VIAQPSGAGLGVNAKTGLAAALTHPARGRAAL
jgi:hypothetical protein